ncbi:hypothetical protein KC19_VG047800 [Ceratodon purpureus]|uniref:Uncharacterized protein n=1 Tax=Ceratodon purpureus TaxID=3225 RepID=A0A8T0HM05_CERPU|nr:hypothetical protein KC19_VG047800 [Ceratodon purpureus]
MRTLTRAPFAIINLGTMSKLYSLLEPRNARGFSPPLNFYHNLSSPFHHQYYPNEKFHMLKTTLRSKDHRPAKRRSVTSILISNQYNTKRNKTLQQFI